MKVKVIGIPRLEEFANNLQFEFETATMTATQNIARTLHKYLLRLTPIDTGNLRKMWSANGNLDFTVVPCKNGYEVTLKNEAAVLGRKVQPFYYALLVNDGHRQTPGRYVPGYIIGDKFHYDPNAKSGVILKQSWIQGKFFVEKSIALTKAQLERVVYAELTNWWRRL